MRKIINDVEIFDAQVHVWRGVQPGVKPHRPHPFTGSELLAEMRAANVDRAVLVPPSWAHADGNAVALDAARDHPDRFRVMARLDPPFASTTPLIDLLGQRGFRGFRLAAHGERAAWLADDRLAPICRLLNDRRIPLMIYPPGSFPQVRTLAMAYPDMPIIVDHCGLSMDTHGPADIDATVTKLASLAAFPNIYVKVSALPRHIDEAFPFPGLRPIIRRVIDAFGVERTFWGSDMTLSPVPYAESVTYLFEHRDLTGRELSMVMGESLLRLLDR